MVNWLFIFSSFIVPLIANTLVTITILGIVYIKRINPLIENANEVFSGADKAIKKGMSAMGEKSGQVRLDKSMTKAVANDLMDSQVPEIKAFLGLISPETLEMFEDNPDSLLRIAQKYGHLIGLNFNGSEKPETPSDYDF